jgi:hypothetical protein
MAARTIQVPSAALPVIDEAEVVVVGGGSSGFIAATAAARAGARTILVERFGYLGGCTTAPYNTTIGLFFDSEGNQIIKGIPWEFVDRMIAAGEANDMRPRSPEIWPPTTKKIAIDMVTDAKVELYFYTWFSDVLMDGDAVKGIIVETKAGRGVILGRTFVDCSGDADIAARAGAPFEMTDVENLQQVSCDYIACGVDAARVRAWAAANQESMNLRVSGLQFEPREAGAQHMLTITIPTEHTTDGYHVGVQPTVKLCVYREAVRLQGNVEINPLDPRALTYAETHGIKGAMDHLAYLKKMVPGFENVFLVAQSHLGVRETRRILGDYYLTIDDLKGQKRFDDVVCLNCRALDYHLKGTVFKIESLKGNHDIPLRALLPKKVANVIVAGRSISGDHLSQASLRGAATCMATGQSAGLAAALAARGNGRLRDLDIRSLQKALVGQDVILGTGSRAAVLASRVA